MTSIYFLFLFLWCGQFISVVLWEWLSQEVMVVQLEDWDSPGEIVPLTSHFYVNSNAQIIPQILRIMNTKIKEKVLLKFGSS